MLKKGYFWNNYCKINLLKIWIFVELSKHIILKVMNTKANVVKKKLFHNNTANNFFHTAIKYFILSWSKKKIPFSHTYLFINIINFSEV